MTVAQAVVPRWSEPDLRLEVDTLLNDLRRNGFDLRRAAFVGYLLELQSDRDGAYAVRDRAVADGWQVTLFGDQSGWVVRLGRVEVVRAEQLGHENRYVEGLSRAYGGWVRGVCVEDLQRTDVWDQLAARSCAETDSLVSPQPADPLPRRATQSVDRAQREPARSA